MISPSIDICWSLAEAEAAHAGFSEIELAHFWVGVCKAVEVSVSELLKDGSPELQAMEGQVESDFMEVREAFSAVGVSPKQLRRSIRAELGKGSGHEGRPLHRCMALRKVFKTATSVAKADGERLRPMHLIASMSLRIHPARISASSTGSLKRSNASICS